MATPWVASVLAALASPHPGQPSPAPPGAAEAPPPIAETDEQARTLPSIPTAETEAVPAVDLSAAYTFDVWHVARGGVRRGWRYLDNLDLTARVSLERAIGWQGATLFAYALYNNGRGLSEDLVGDAQGVSNIETPVAAVRLYEAWLEQRLVRDRASVKVGLYDLNSEFDTNDTGSLFLNSSHGIGADFSQSGRNGPSIFPVTALALRVDYRLDAAWLVRAAILDGIPGDPGRPRRTAVRLGGGDGALLVAEVEYRSGATKLLAGYWRYTARFEAIGPGPSPGRPRTGSGNDGAYLLAERRLARFGADEARNLAGWLRVGAAEDEFNPADLYLGGGLVATGTLESRPQDQFGLAVAGVRFGRPFRQVPTGPGQVGEREEIAFEATYRAVLAPWLSLQPDLQYVVNPGGRSDLRDALAVAIRVQIGLP